MNQKLKTSVLEVIKRTTVQPRTFKDPATLAYHADITPFFLRIQRTKTNNGFTYVLSAHGVELTPFVTVPNSPQGFVSADMVDLPEIWRAMEEKYQAQQREVPMDHSQKHWAELLNKVISEYDATRALEQNMLDRSKQIVK